jgi:hypothetical protein
MRRILAGSVVMATAVLVGCHTITEELPTEPTTTTPSPAPATANLLTVPIPALTVGTTTPAPKPTATPAPAPGTPTPTPTPATAPPPAPAPPAPAPTPPPEETPSGGGGGGGGGADGCGAPLPPAISKVKVKIHIRGVNKYTLDSTPLVSGAKYCAKIGFTDGRTRCPVRPEGHPERHACEAYAVGLAEDTGRTGPTWTRNSSYCTDEDHSGCENHPDNQYLLWAYKSGFYEACVKGGVCGSVDVDR